MITLISLCCPKRNTTYVVPVHTTKRKVKLFTKPIVDNEKGASPLLPAHGSFVELKWPSLPSPQLAASDTLSKWHILFEKLVSTGFGFRTTSGAELLAEGRPMPTEDRKRKTTKQQTLSSIQTSPGTRHWLVSFSLFGRSNKQSQKQFDRTHFPCPPPQKKDLLKVSPLRF